MQEIEANRLLERYRSGQCTEEEKVRLRNWFHTIHLDEPVDLSADELSNISNNTWDVISSQTQSVTSARPVKRLWPHYLIAATVLMTIGIASYYLFLREEPVKHVAQTKTDVLPGGNKAILTLASGKKIVLSNVKNGIIAAHVVKKADGDLFYEKSGENGGTVEFNTMSTPRGGQYHLTLADGTNVWLNAASSITYPTAFNGNERKVTITGEAYFEVKHNAKQPFRVSVKGQSIEDLGTQFNINAYDDEPNIKATLIEGSIKINDQKTIIPGQRAIIGNNQIQLEKADTEQAVAWKNGLFNFNNTTLTEAMRQLSRWYDVEVSYQTGLPKTVLQGEMQRNMNASQVLDVLSFFKVHFQIIQSTNGKKIIVKP